MRATGEAGVSGRSIFQGYALQQVDQKGRVAIPAVLRDTLIANTPGAEGGKEVATLFLSTHESDRCLVGFDASFAQLRHERLIAREERALNETGAVDHNIMRSGLGATEPLPFDSSGRFILPAFPKNYAKIDRFAFFYGVGGTFEIWDPATLIANPNAPEIMKEAARFYMAEKGVAL